MTKKEREEARKEVLLLYMLYVHDIHTQTMHMEWQVYSHFMHEYHHYYFYIGESAVPDEALKYCCLPGVFPGWRQPVHCHGLLRWWRPLQEDQWSEGQTLSWRTGHWVAYIYIYAGREGVIMCVGVHNVCDRQLGWEVGSIEFHRWREIHQFFHVFLPTSSCILYFVTLYRYSTGLYSCVWPSNTCTTEKSCTET